MNKKWIAGIIGWAIGGPIGALLGFTLGAAIDSQALPETEHINRSPLGQRNSFLLSLLVLSSAVMKADGKVMKSELTYIKNFIRLNFGEQAVTEALNILKDLRDKEINIYEVSAQIRINTNISQRLQLFHYLCGIATADLNPSASEKDILIKIAQALKLPDYDINSIMSMFGKSIDDAYNVLGINSDATDQEVKRAYRKMAMKHHPDKVASLGEDVRKSAEEKFKAISTAYNTIKKIRGIQ
ncbi:MAG: DnaJ domain-containing protein [Bacteroidales bacterium]